VAALHPDPLGEHSSSPSPLAMTRTASWLTQKGRWELLCSYRISDGKKEGRKRGWDQWVDVPSNVVCGSMPLLNAV